MYIIQTNSFKKDFKRLHNSKKEKVKRGLKLFQENQFIPQLRYHKLKGFIPDVYSISVDYDLRVLFRYEQDKIVVILISVGTHEQVY